MSDTSRAVGEQYGAKKEPGEQWADFPRRITFLVDPTGVVRRVYQVTDVAKNPQDVLDDIEELST